MQEYNVLIIAGQDEAGAEKEVQSITQYSETAFDSMGTVEDWVTTLGLPIHPSTARQRPVNLSVYHFSEKGHCLSDHCGCGRGRQLRGDPKALIESLPWHPTSYLIGPKSLDENHGGFEFGGDQHMAELMSIPKIRNTNDVVKLRSLVNKVNASIRMLDSLDNELESYSVAFWPVLRTAIPSKLFFDFSECQLSIEKRGTENVNRKHELMHIDRLGNPQSLSIRAAVLEAQGTRANAHTEHQGTCARCGIYFRRPQRQLPVVASTFIY